MVYRSWFPGKCDMPRHDLWLVLQSSLATDGFVLLHVTARSHIPHGNFGFLFGGGFVMFGVVWARCRGPGFCSTSPLVRSVCFPVMIKQGCVVCKVVVSACSLTMSHKVTMTCLFYYYPWNIVAHYWMKRGWWPLATSNRQFRVANGYLTVDKTDNLPPSRLHIHFRPSWREAINIHSGSRL